MAAQTGITIIKSFPYRGVAEEYSNQYWFTGAVPADATAWRALFDALVTAEIPIYKADVEVVGGYGYDSDLDGAVAVWSLDLTVSPEVPVAGTHAIGTSPSSAGDSAVWVRWKTSRLNTKGKAIYLRKYFHPGYPLSAALGDEIWTGQKTALLALGTKLDDASFIDARTITALGQTDTILSHGASSYLTTRTLKRRGRRPTV